MVPEKWDQAVREQHSRLAVCSFDYEARVFPSGYPCSPLHLAVGRTQGLPAVMWFIPEEYLSGKGVLD